MPDVQKAKLDAEALRTFVAVAQLRSFSAAAAMLHRTTSAISYRVKCLEDSMGTPLFQRTTRSVTLTPSGEVLLEKANVIFSWLQVLPEELQQVNAGIEPRFTLVINNLLYRADAVSALLVHLNELFPHCIFEVRQAVYMGVWDDMINNGGHMAFGVPGFHTIDDEFLTEPLGIVNWVFVVAPDHPLAAETGILDNDLLRRYPAINVQDTSMRLTKRTAWRLAGQREILVPDLQAKLNCHLRGLGVGFLPSTLVRDLIKQKRLVEKRIVAGRSPSPLALAWRRQGAGKIMTHLRNLCLARDPLIAPLLATMEVLTQPAAAAADSLHLRPEGSGA